ncbi:MAG TPA: hypothetical protein VHB49_14930 [Bradyrhizobium sp.]|nr:hypothetical protein [Bradyrhizobium sp.]
MSISALGATSGSVGSTYNFTNVTNEQFLQEIQDLGQQGALSKNEQVLATLAASGGDSVPINGLRPTTAQTLSDQTLHDFITELQGDDNSAHMPGAVGGALYDSLLQKLQSYQGTAIGSSSQSGSTTA